MSCLVLCAAPTASQDLGATLANTPIAALLVKAEGRTLTLATPMSRIARVIRREGVDDIAEVQIAHSGTKAVVLTNTRLLAAFDLTRDSPILKAYAQWRIGTALDSRIGGGGSHRLSSARFSFVVDGSIVVVDESLTPVKLPAEIPAGLVAARMGSPGTNR